MVPTWFLMVLIWSHKVPHGSYTVPDGPYMIPTWFLKVPTWSNMVPDGPHVFST